MWKQVLETLWQTLRLAEETQQNRQNIKKNHREFAKTTEQEIQELRRVTERLVAAIERLGEREEAERRILKLERMRTKDYAGGLQFIAASRRWPDNLGAGKPYQEEIDERLEDWLEAFCDERLGRQAETNVALSRVASFKLRRDNAGTLITAWALQKLGNQTEAENLINGWVARQPENRLAKWCLSILSKIGGSRKMPGRKIALNLRGLIFLPHIFLLKPGPVRDTPPRIFETIRV
jgi:hypothetical protein